VCEGVVTRALLSTGSARWTLTCYM